MSGLQSKFYSSNGTHTVSVIFNIEKKVCLQNCLFKNRDIFLYIITNILSSIPESVCSKIFCLIVLFLNCALSIYPGVIDIPMYDIFIKFLMAIIIKKNSKCYNERNSSSFFPPNFL